MIARGSDGVMMNRDSHLSEKKEKCSGCQAQEERINNLTAEVNESKRLYKDQLEWMDNHIDMIKTHVLSIENKVMSFDSQMHQFNFGSVCKETAREEASPDVFGYTEEFLHEAPAGELHWSKTRTLSKVNGFRPKNNEVQRLHPITKHSSVYEYVRHLPENNETPNESERQDARRRTENNQRQSYASITNKRPAVSRQTERRVSNVARREHIVTRSNELEKVYVKGLPNVSHGELRRYLSSFGLRTASIANISSYGHNTREFLIECEFLDDFKAFIYDRQELRITSSVESRNSNHEVSLCAHLANLIQHSEQSRVKEFAKNWARSIGQKMVDNVKKHLETFDDPPDTSVVTTQVQNDHDTIQQQQQQHKETLESQQE